MSESGNIGVYTVVRPLGRGAGSTIYEVTGKGTGQPQALKLVALGGPEDKKFLDQLETERDCSLAVSHPAVRRCSDLVKTSKFFRVTQAYLVMEFVEGRSLADRRPESIVDQVAIFVQVAEALAAISDAGWVHADIKPANIIVSPTGKVKVIDLGQACPVGTVKERVQGTPDYIAPEQVKRHPLTSQTDMFNLGATMYWCLTGATVPTLIAGEESSTAKGSRGKGYPRPVKLNPDIPPHLDRLIGDCLRTSPANRPERWDSVVSRLRLVHHQLGNPDPAEIATDASVLEDTWVA